jgi:hypothetical protein
MPELSAQLPAIIAKAAKSPLGIFALMINAADARHDDRR